MMGLTYAVTHSIRGGNGRDVSTGTRSLMLYDVVGAIAGGGKAGRRMTDEIGATAQMRTVLAGQYSAARIDRLGQDPSSAAFLDAISTDRLRTAWFARSLAAPALGSLQLAH
jgi:hypothetical protein